MRRFPSVDPLDVLALVALAILAAGVAFEFGPGWAAIVVGVVLLAYVYLASRPVPPTRPGGGA